MNTENNHLWEIRGHKFLSCMAAFMAAASFFGAGVLMNDSFHVDTDSEFKAKVEEKIEANMVAHAVGHTLRNTQNLLESLKIARENGDETVNFDLGHNTINIKELHIEAEQDVISSNAFRQNGLRLFSGFTLVFSIAATINAVHQNNLANRYKKISQDSNDKPLI